jgi:hypothetical protein
VGQHEQAAERMRDILRGHLRRKAHGGAAVNANGCLVSSQYCSIIERASRNGTLIR